MVGFISNLTWEFAIFDVADYKMFIEIPKFIMATPRWWKKFPLNFHSAKLRNWVFMKKLMPKLSLKL